MGANPVNLGAVTAMGAQFKHNIFDKPTKAFLRLANAPRKQPGSIQYGGSGTTNYRTTASKRTVSAPAGLPRAGGNPPAAAGGGQRRGPFTPPGGGSGGRGGGGLPPGTPRIQATSIRLDRDRTSAGTTARPMGPNRTALPSAARPALPGGARLALPAGSSGGAPKVQNSAQFANVTTRDNSPFPTHQHPEGSSNLKLQNLSANQPRQNEFTVGSRNAKPGGIAAKGSQLEAWAISKSNAVQARQASRKAGGRDKALSTAAKAAENFANQPLRNFAP